MSGGAFALSGADVAGNHGIFDNRVFVSIRQAGNRTNATEYNGRSITWSYDGTYRLTNESISGDPSKANANITFS